MASIKTPSKRSSVPPKRRSSLNMKAVQLPKTVTFIVTDGEKAECPVCGGEVVSGSEVIETERGHRQRDIGIFCRRCGLRYQFFPTNATRRKPVR